MMKTYQDDELTHLRNVQEKASDFVLARHNAEFAKLNGGTDALAEELQKAVFATQDFYESTSGD